MFWSIEVIQLVAAVAGLIAAIIGLIVVVIQLRQVRNVPRGQRRTRILIAIKTGAKWAIIVLIIPVITMVSSGIILNKFIKQSPCIGRAVGTRESFSVSEHYSPSGYMGDINDLTVISLPELDRFVYRPTGIGQHEWEYKYIDGKLNERPCKFAGVMYLNPPNNFGERCGGFDLRPVKEVIRWEARSAEDNVYVEFVIGGINWIWNEQTKQKVTPPFPDSMPVVHLGVKKLTSTWQSFEYSLSDLPKKDFRRVLGGFGWVISWSSNGVETDETGNAPRNPKVFTIEIRNIRYERR